MFLTNLQTQVLGNAMDRLITAIHIVSLSQALSCVLVTLWPIEIDKNQIFTFLATIFIALNGHVGLVI